MDDLRHYFRTDVVIANDRDICKCGRERAEHQDTGRVKFVRIAPGSGPTQGTRFTSAADDCMDFVLAKVAPKWMT